MLAAGTTYGVFLNGTAVPPLGRPRLRSSGGIAGPPLLELPIFGEAERQDLPVETEPCEATGMNPDVGDSMVETVGDDLLIGLADDMELAAANGMARE